MDGFPCPYYRRSDRRRAPWRVSRDQWGRGEAVPSIESGGARIDYTVHGDGRSSSSVMLLAGFTAPATSWRYQIPSLTQAGHRVIAVDLPGHGTAPAMPHGTTMQTRAGLVHALIEQLDLRDAAMIGGSMGANTIWSYVDTYGTGRLRAAVVVDQTPRMLNAPEWAYGSTATTRRRSTRSSRTGFPRPATAPRSGNAVCGWSACSPRWAASTDPCRHRNSPC